MFKTLTDRFWKTYKAECSYCHAETLYRVFMLLPAPKTIWGRAACGHCDTTTFTRLEKDGEP